MSRERTENGVGRVGGSRVLDFSKLIRMLSEHQRREWQTSSPRQPDDWEEFGL